MYVNESNVERAEEDGGVKGVHICNHFNMIEIESKYEQKRRPQSK